MSQDTTIRSGDVPVNPEQIEATLQELWKQYANQVRDDEPMGARARLANLICWCEDDTQVERAGRAVAELSLSRPVRSIILVVGGDGESSASASIQCGLAGPRPVCYEEVRIRAAGETACALPSLIEPLTVTDLPTFLWFPGDPALDSEEAVRLLPYVDRVVTDGHEFVEPAARFRRIHSLAREHEGRIVFTDMAWSRFGTWREAVGKQFDPEDSRAFLASIRAVDFTSASARERPTDRELLMAGWLASRLGWRPRKLESGDPARALFEASNGTVPVAFHRTASEPPDRLLRMDIRCPDVTFSVRRTDDEEDGAIRASITCSGDTAEGPAYRPHKPTPGELLVSAMEIRTPFVDWEDALAAIAGLEE